MPNPAVWTFDLVDNTGARLCELTTAQGKTLAFKRNDVPEVTLTISHEDDAAQLLMDCIANSGWPRLKAYRRGPNDASAVLRFYGYLAPSGGDLEETALLSLVFRGPFGQLVGDGENRGRYTDDVIGTASANIGLIAQSLVDIYAGNHEGSVIARSAFPAITAKGKPIGLFDALSNVLPDGLPSQQITYQYHNVGQAIQDLSNLLDGFDFEVVPDDGSADFVLPQIVNPSLDDDLTGWSTTSGTLTRDTSVFDSTPASAKLVSSLGRLSASFHGEPFRAGVQYTLTFAYKVASGAFNLFFEFGAGAFGVGDAAEVSVPSITSFGQQSITWTPRTDQAADSVAFTARCNADTGTLWADSLTLSGHPPNGVMGNLVLYFPQGQDRPSARFEYGEKTLSNVSAVQHTIEPPVNHVRVLGTALPPKSLTRRASPSTASG